MKFAEFAYKHAQQSDSAVVIAGGPSTGSNMLAIKDYIKRNNSVVYSANYNYDGLNIDYTYIGDVGRFVKLIHTVDSPHIIVSNWLRSKTRFSLPNNSQKVADRMWKKCLKKHTVYRMGRGKKINNRRLKSWKSLPTGEFNFTPTPSGFAALVLATMSRPKKILVVGLDGPRRDKKGNLIKERYDNHIKSYRSNAHYKYRKRILGVLALPFIRAKGIEVETFSDCRLWGIGKKKFGIRHL